ncbi:MAG: tyrosine-type recombinase/integrase [Bacilli bacterium]|nr:tyrosine-type recombinase/integrase [Bacilli bacterium]
MGRKKSKYCEKANVKKIRINDFRHSHASLLLSKNVPITVISKRLGHSDIDLTLNVYSHMISKDEDKVVNILNQIKQK